MNEEFPIDDKIRDAAKSEYNRPPATPLDDMWNAIASAGATAGPRLYIAPVAGIAATRKEVRTGSRFAQRFVWFGMAAAAAVLIATGVGIGRFTSRTAPAAAISEKPIAVMAEAPKPVPAAPDVKVGSVPSGTMAPVASNEATPSATAPQSRSREEMRRNPRVVGTGVMQPLFASTYPVATLEAAPVNAPYQVATQRHLTDAEALLTSFSMGTRDARMDAQFAVWAKGLLSNTRLLLDSPAGDDPRRAKLFQDLELVLAQIVQLSPNAAAQDRELIEGSIETGHVMTRLRTAIPAGQPRGITER